MRHKKAFGTTIRNFTRSFHRTEPGGNRYLDRLEDESIDRSHPLVPWMGQSGTSWVSPAYYATPIGVAQLMRRQAMPNGGLLERLLTAALKGIQYYARGGELQKPAR